MDVTGIWSEEEASEHHMHCKKLERVLIKLLEKEQPVIDLGCGRGTYVKAFDKAGFKAFGVEGTKVKHALIQQADLSKPLKLDLPEGQVICLEVGEHVPKQHEQTFLDNVVKYSGGLVILSWAIVGQGGYGHVNERSNEYIVKEMAHRSHTYDKLLTKVLRTAVAGDPCYWFSNTLLAFRKAA